MVQTLIVTGIEKIKKAIPAIENRVKIRVSFSGNKITIKGAELNEYVVSQILHAVDFGFDVEDALILQDPDFTLRFLNIKDYTHKKNLAEVRARVIGTDGRAKGTIEELTGSRIVIHDNNIGVIADSDHVDFVVQAFASLIAGAKHANVFSYLEKQNINLRKFDDDLGLKDERGEKF